MPHGVIFMTTQKKILQCVNIRIDFGPFVGDWTTGEDKPDPPSNSWAVILHKANSRNSHGWNFAFRLHLHPALFYPQQYLVRNVVCPCRCVRCFHLPVFLTCCPSVLQVSPDVLHVWIPLFGFHYFGHHLLRGNNSALLLPPVCRGISLFFPYIFPKEVVHLDCSLATCTTNIFSMSIAPAPFCSWRF